ncbi:Na+/H+ antiporter NhaA [Methylopila turkensis]|uniref:Na(+)/H(+) antiporter NhaA n=1 Tax=Methylopila turkensis TaxID=1437816 RepID=A0A9W6N8X9_9HYPH|nr:Na+/H+ antiporter NhaA [Methylopila turkensis]GLK81836.1 Na(+)/H(+) antiporter NhaA 1 [Methylopila turkensis]
MSAAAPQLKPSKSPLRSFFANEASAGLILMAAAALGLIVANSPLATAYFATLKAYVGGLSVLHWINDALMVVFFLLVGLEIKRELLEGRLRTWPDRVLPGLAAIGGMAAPALVYLIVNASSPETLRGWAIPAATDIAFALGVLTLLGSRVPISLKVFLTALAIIDDLGAVLIIAVFYTAELSLPMLAASAVTFAALVAMNRLGVRRLTPYLLLGLVLWFFVLKSGVHATVAGVLLAMTIPIGRKEGEAESPLHRLEHGVTPWSAFVVLPVFGFANAGVSFAGVEARMLLEPVTLGVALGLFLGKQIGIFGIVLAAVKLGLAKRPEGASWGQVYGISLLCGIGFTMSLFIGLLAFADAPHLEAETKIGVLVGSLSCMALGALVLRLTSPSQRPTERATQEA